MNAEILARDGGGGIIVVEGRWERGDGGWPSVSFKTGERRGDDTLGCEGCLPLK